MPPAVTRAFGFCAIEDEKEIPVDKHGNRLVVPSEIAKKCGQQDEGAKVHKAPMGLGSDCGMVTNPATGQPIDAGRLLMRDAWNSALYPPLDAIYEEGRRRAVRPDKWVHKNRMSGMWGARTACEDFLEREDIRTLFFGGVNTDQCVGGTLTDAFSKGYDCILLTDGAATSSPIFAQKCFEFNAANTFGFAMTCKALAEGVNAMQAEV